MGKFTDDIPMVRVDQARPPILAAELYRDLHVSGANRQDKADAIKAWLKTNTPTPQLAASLQRHNFGWLLNGDSAA